MGLRDCRAPGFQGKGLASGFPQARAEGPRGRIVTRGNGMRTLQEVLKQCWGPGAIAPRGGRVPCSPLTWTGPLAPPGIMCACRARFRSNPVPGCMWPLTPGEKKALGPGRQVIEFSSILRAGIPLMHRSTRGVTLSSDSSLWGPESRGQLLSGHPRAREAGRPTVEQL